MPCEDDVEGVFHPGAGLHSEGFGELRAVDQGLEVDDIEEVELGEEFREVGILEKYRWAC